MNPDDQIEEWKLDAARYRWLRDHAHWGIKHRFEWYMPYNETSLDANIDAAIKEAARRDQTRS